MSNENKPSPQSVLKGIKALSLKDADVQLYLGQHKSGTGRKGVYCVFQVKRDEALADKLREGVIEKIEQANEAKKFEPLSEDQDSTVLVGSSADTEWAGLAEHLVTNKNGEIASLTDLLGANFYVVELVLPTASLYAVKKLSEKWTAKRAKDIQTVFSEGVLKNVDNGKLLRMERGVDFFFYRDSFVILNKKNFESVLNFRAGMIKARDEVLKEIDGLGKFEGVDAIRDKAEDKMPYLRRLATIRNSGHFREADFMEKLFAVVKKFGWDIQFSEDGKIVITPENVDTVLHLLNNDRVASLINQEMYDAIVKKPVN